MRDATSGFFLIRRDLARGVTISAGGFKICLELLVRGRPASVVEVPYVFVGRTAGESKMNLKEALGYLQQLRDLQAPSSRQHPPLQTQRHQRRSRAAELASLASQARRRARDAAPRALTASVSTVRAPNSVRDSTCQTIACLVSASRTTSPRWRAM